ERLLAPAQLGLPGPGLRLLLSRLALRGFILDRAARRGILVALPAFGLRPLEALVQGIHVGRVDEGGHAFPRRPRLFETIQRILALERLDLLLARPPLGPVA